MYIITDSKTNAVLNIAHAPSEIPGFTPPNGQTATFLNDSEANTIPPNWSDYTYTNGTFTLIPPTLEDVQQEQLSAVNAGYNATIAAGFTSNATGSADIYAIDESAYPKWTGILTIINSGNGPSSITVKDIKGNKVTLTASQFKQFSLDGFNFLNAQEQQLWALEDQIEAQTTVPATPIAWSPGAFTPQPAPATTS